MSQIQAAVCHSFDEPLRIETVDLRAPHGSEVEVSLGAVALCHSDIAYAAGAWGAVPCLQFTAMRRPAQSPVSGPLSAVWPSGTVWL